MTFPKITRKKLLSATSIRERNLMRHAQYAEAAKSVTMQGCSRGVARMYGRMARECIEHLIEDGELAAAQQVATELTASIIEQVPAIESTAA